MAGSDLRHDGGGAAAPRGGRRGERGATLTFLTGATGVAIVALATAYLSSAEAAYRLSAHRAREAQVLAAADGALAEALIRLERDRAAKVDGESLREGTRLTVAMTSTGPRAELTITATGGDPAAPITRRLTATVDLAEAGPIRIARVRRE